MQERRRELLDPTAGVYRYDQLIVLKSTRMPAVLLEAGSIVNREEEVLISTPAHQSIIAAAVTQAVGIFCRNPHHHRCHRNPHSTMDMNSALLKHALRRADR